MCIRDRAKSVGCLIGFAGVVLVNLGGGEGLGGGFAFNGEGFLLIACISYAFSSVLVKIFSARENPVTLSGYQFVMGGIITVSYTHLDVYKRQGQFAPGSMLPKVEAAMKFVRSYPDKKAIITSLDKAIDALEGKTGTVITFA